MARGRPSKGDRQGLTIRLPAEVHQEVKVHCAGQGKEMGDLITKVFLDWWEQQTEARKAAQEFIAKSKAKTEAA